MMRLFSLFVFLVGIPSLSFSAETTKYDYANPTSPIPPYLYQGHGPALHSTDKEILKTVITPNNEELYLQARSDSTLTSPSEPPSVRTLIKPLNIIKKDNCLPSNTSPLRRTVSPKASKTIHIANTTNTLPKRTSDLIPDTRISFEFQKTDLRDVLQAFSTFIGTNFIISDQVNGSVSLRLDKVPWRTAFDLLLDSHGLAMRQRDHVLWIAPAADIARQERQHFEARAQALDTSPLTPSIFPLHYQRAEEMRTVLNGTGGERFLSKRGIAMADSRTNQLIVLDNLERIAQIKALLLAIDRPSAQVSIEAQIVEAEEGFSRSLGSRLSVLGASAGVLPVSRTGSELGTGESAASSRLRTTHLLPGEKNTLYDLPAGSLSGFNPASIGFTLFGVGASRIIALELSMLEARGQGKILSSPRVVTADRVKAIIEQGTELPYQAKVGNGVSGVQFRRAGLKLEVTPRIMPNGYVTLEVEVSKDSVGADTLSGPAIHTKHVQTQVHVEDAGTVAIGGIFTRDQRSDLVRLPVLGELPILGALFRRSVKNNRKNELLIFLTPHIITQPRPPSDI